MQPAWGMARAAGTLVGMQTSLIHIAVAKARRDR
jgi:hypothetical protein